MQFCIYHYTYLLAVIEESSSKLCEDGNLPFDVGADLSSVSKENNIKLSLFYFFHLMMDKVYQFSEVAFDGIITLKFAMLVFLDYHI